VREYYDARAAEYDEWYVGLGSFDGLDRRHWDDELHLLERTIAALPPARTLDVACGTAFLTRHLRGSVTGLDQSERMLTIARERMPGASFIQGDAFDLKVEDGSFDRVSRVTSTGISGSTSARSFCPKRAASRLSSL
jgi:ubiquinone/menaquinone biosynthesis C-methylase UbiE